LALAEAAGGKRERRLPRLFLTDDEREQAYQTLRALGWDGTTPLLGCHPFSSVVRKEWGDENFAALLAWASSRWGFRPIIFGSPCRARPSRTVGDASSGHFGGRGTFRCGRSLRQASWCAGVRRGRQRTRPHRRCVGRADLSPLRSDRPATDGTVGRAGCRRPIADRGRCETLPSPLPNQRRSAFRRRWRADNDPFRRRPHPQRSRKTLSDALKSVSGRTRFSS
jgi:hypothetical protein